MAAHRSAVLFLLGALAPVALPIQAADQAPVVGYDADAPAALAPPRRFVNYYLFPLGPNFYQCCTEREDVIADVPLAAPSAAGEEASGASPPAGVTIADTRGRVLRSSARTACIRHSELTPAERARRALTAVCADFGVYDHFMCSCETLCSNPNWSCDCPGIPAGELPVIGPQDSLRSRPEFIRTDCFPCNEQTTCDGAEAPPAGGGLP